MFDKFSKYLIVNAKDITKTIYRSERIFTANDGYNRYAKDGAINITEIFEKNNVPKEFQIVIINLNELYETPHLFPQIKKAKEFFTDKPLELHIKKMMMEYILKVLVIQLEILWILTVPHKMNLKLSQYMPHTKRY